MNRLRLTTAALTVLGIAGAASQTSATTTVFPLNYDTGNTTDIYLDTTNAVFQYQSDSYFSPDKAYFSAQGSGMISDSFQSGPTFSSAAGFYDGSTTVSKDGAYYPVGNYYLSLEFNNDAGHLMNGVAQFDTYGDLVDIVYAPAVPEPAEWALLILGAGLAGGAVRAQRRGAVEQS